MQKNIRYHKYSKINFFLNSIPLRILKFKRPKWKRVQKKLKYFLFSQRKVKKKNLKNKKRIIWRKKKKIFFNYLKIKKTRFFFDKYKKIFKKGLQLKSSWHVYTGNLFKNKKLKKKVIKNKIIKELQMFLKPLFRIDLLLWKLNISKSRIESKLLILNGLISINNIKIFDEKIYIRQGDIIFIDPKICRLKSYKIKRFQYPLEVDFYSNTLLISKNFQSTNVIDYAFLKFDVIPYRKLYNFLKTY